MADNDLEPIGLEAVLKDESFQAGVKRYDKSTDQMIEKTKSTSNALSSFGRVIETGVGTALGFLTAKAIPEMVGGLKSFIDSAAEAEKIEKGLDTVLEATGGAAGVTKEAALDLAAGFAQLTTFEDDSVVAAESVLLRFKSINKDTFPQATELTLDLAQALGMDLSSAAKLLGKALEDPAAGMGRLRVAGVNLTDEQEKLVKKMAESGNTAGAQKLIMDELAKSVGGAAKAAGQTAEGQWKIFQNQLGNLGETVGAAFLPVLTELVKTINKDILPAFQSWIEDAMPSIQQALADFGTLITENWPKIQKVIIDAWTAIQPVLGALSALFTENEDKVGDFANVFYYLGEALGLSKEDMNTLYLAAENLGSAMLETWGAIRNAVTTAWAVVSPVLQAIFSALAKFWVEVQPKLIAAWSAIMIKVQEAWDFIWNQVIQPIVSVLVKFIQDHHEEIKTIIVSVFSYLKGFIDVTWAAISGIIKIALDLISGDFEGAAADWDEMMSGVMAGLQTMFYSAWEAIKGIFGLALGALVSAVTAKASSIATEMTAAINGAITAISNLYSSFVSAGNDLIAKIISGIQTAPSTIASAISSAISAATSLPAEVWSAVTSIGSTIISKIVEGIKDPLSSISSAIAQLIKDAISAATSIITGKKDIRLGFDFASGAQRLDFARAGAAGTSYANSTVINNFNLTTNSIASASALASDFGIMRSLAGA